MEQLIEDICDFNRDIRGTEISGITIKDRRREILDRIERLDEVEIRLLFRELAIRSSLGQFFDILVNRMSEDSLKILTLELRLLSPEVHKKMRNGLLQAMKKKHKMAMWNSVSKFVLT